MIELAALYYEVRSRFYNTDIDTYFSSCHELNIIAKTLGYTSNDIVKVLIGV